jgi:hypothetical protein
MTGVEPKSSSDPVICDRGTGTRFPVLLFTHDLARGCPASSHRLRVVVCLIDRDTDDLARRISEVNIGRLGLRCEACGVTGKDEGGLQRHDALSEGGEGHPGVKTLRSAVDPSLT